MSKVKIYVWQRETIKRPRWKSIQEYGAELTWDKGYLWLNPLFKSRGEATKAARKLAKVIEAGLELSEGE